MECRYSTSSFRVYAVKTLVEETYKDNSSGKLLFTRCSTVSEWVRGIAKYCQAVLGHFGCLPVAGAKSDLSHQIGVTSRSGALALVKRRDVLRCVLKSELCLKGKAWFGGGSGGSFAIQDPPGWVLRVGLCEL